MPMTAPLMLIGSDVASSSSSASPACTSTTAGSSWASCWRGSGGVYAWVHLLVVPSDAPGDPGEPPGNCRGDQATRAGGGGAASTVGAVPAVFVALLPLPCLLSVSSVPLRPISATLRRARGRGGEVPAPVPRTEDAQERTNRMPPTVTFASARPKELRADGHPAGPAGQDARQVELQEAVRRQAGGHQDAPGRRAWATRRSTRSWWPRVVKAVKDAGGKPFVTDGPGAVASPPQARLHRRDARLPAAAGGRRGRQVRLLPQGQLPHAQDGGAGRRHRGRRRHDRAVATARATATAASAGRSRTSPWAAWTGRPAARSTA